MKKMLYIASHSLNREGDLAVTGENVSSIIDKLIRITAKTTEQYAGDICYTITKLNIDIKEKRNRATLFLFSESGVTCYDFTTSVDDFEALHQANIKTLPLPEKDELREALPPHIQCWMLETYLDVNSLRQTYLRRVDASIKKVLSFDELQTDRAKNKKMSEIKVGDKVYTVAAPLTMDMYGRAVVTKGNALTVLECTVRDIITPDSTGDASTFRTKFTLSAVEDIAGVENASFSRTLVGIPADMCFLSMESARDKMAELLTGEVRTKPMVKAYLAPDSLQVGALVYTLAPALKVNRYGKPMPSRAKNDLVVVQCVVEDIMFSMRYDSPDNWSTAVLLTLAPRNETIPGTNMSPVYRTLSEIPVEKCFYTYEEALHALKEMKGEEK